MKSTQLLDALRNIKKQFVSYISILVIAMLAAVAFLAIAYTASALRKGASDYYDTYRFWDLEIASTLMMDAEDLEAIRAIPGVEYAEPVYQVDAKLLRDDGDLNISVMGLPQRISVPELLEGRLPSA